MFNRISEFAWQSVKSDNPFIVFLGIVLSAAIVMVGFCAVIGSFIAFIGICMFLPTHLGLSVITLVLLGVSYMIAHNN